MSTVKQDPKSKTSTARLAEFLRTQDYDSPREPEPEDVWAQLSRHGYVINGRVVA